MTYMAPNYHPIANIAGVDADAFPFANYRLFLYVEGSASPASRAELNALTRHDIPVLFIPGNAGSGLQVRSYGAHAARLFDASRRTQGRLVFFAVDFAEDMSALNGDLLEYETVYVNHCVAHILSLIPKGGATSVVILAHSMGGMYHRLLSLSLLCI